MKTQSKKIILIGAGNVATQLGIALHGAGHTILQVYSQTKRSAQTLATSINAIAINDLKKIDPEADIYIIAIKDDMVAAVAKKIKIKNGVLVHTSGSTAMSVLKNTSKNYGVFYPLQTFSKNKKVNFKTIPVCLEANNDDTLKTLQQLAASISNNVQKVNSDQRKVLHLAAVFACNFTNHLFAVADKILSENKLPFDILKPLIKETVDKIEKNPPAKMQTGPAARGDKKIMDTHLKMLSKDKRLKQLYELMSKSIIDVTKKNK